MTTPVTPSLTRILHGGDYNPEQWPEAVWDDDVRLMNLSHVNVATLPVFGWVSLQPSEDEFTFEWLDTVIEKLTAGGVSLCLATATASVPAWVDAKYPDILRVDHDGRKVKHGNRHTFCPHSPNFRRLAGNLTRKMAERYGSHPGVVVWHVSNEYGSTCFCDTCATAFRKWLEVRYGSLEAVNAKWYTAFWGHTFTDWSEIEPPTTNAERAMQPLSIDYARFASDSLLECYKMERDIIREYSPNVPVTTNLMGSFKPLDYQRWAKEMDVISWDSYPSRNATPASIAFQHSLMRGLKEGQPWLLMEQTPSQQNWQAYNSLKRPGIMRLWSYQAIAHGSDAVMYFQWRRSRGASEKYHGAVVEHAGRIDTRVFREVAALGAELEALGTQTLSGRVQSKVAIIFDWDNFWAVEFSNGPSVDLKYVAQIQAYHAALHERGIVADIVGCDADLSGYTVVVAPVLYMVKPGVAERVAEFVKAGGTFVTTYFSGIVDETDIVFEGGYPGPLADLLGIWVEEIDVLSPDMANSVKFDAFAPLSGRELPSSQFCDIIHTERGATAIATYGSDFYAGTPAITINQFGDGKAYYVGTMLTGDGLGEFLVSVCTDAGVTLPLGAAKVDGIEIVQRASPSGSVLSYVLNHNAAPATVALPAHGPLVDILTGASVLTDIKLDAYGVAILREE